MVEYDVREIVSLINNYYLNFTKVKNAFDEIGVVMRFLGFVTFSFCTRAMNRV